MKDVDDGDLLAGFEHGSLAAGSVEDEAVGGILMKQKRRRSRLFRGSLGEGRMKTGAHAIPVSGKPRLEVFRCDLLNRISIGLAGANERLHHDDPSRVDPSPVPGSTCTFAAPPARARS